jgi:hypothetical protein
VPANKNAALFILNYIRKGLLSCEQSIQNWVSVEAGDAGPEDSFFFLEILTKLKLFRCLGPCLFSCSPSNNPCKYPRLKSSVPLHRIAYL